MYDACDAGGAADGRRPLPPTQLRSGLRAARNAELDKRREVAALSRRVTRERRRVAHDSHVLRFRQRAMSTREELGKLSSSSSADDLIELRYEIVGSQNRISTEQRRYAEALAEWEGVAQQWGPSLALRVGIAEDHGG